MIQQIEVCQKFYFKPKIKLTINTLQTITDSFESAKIAEKVENCKNHVFDTRKYEGFFIKSSFSIVEIGIFGFIFYQKNDFDGKSQI